ncbi:hypothetical protein AND_010204 [Anopheles darlingi]|uniref:Uncharacterized protein n=1 Tax=Anopheles darlingi TaxID=43151 RepID=W5J1T6_ANODA|nr:hypothetical protein AND_010204 [Anopheles darlingi]
MYFVPSFRCFQKTITIMVEKHNPSGKLQYVKMLELFADSMNVALLIHFAIYKRKISKMWLCLKGDHSKLLNDHNNHLDYRIIWKKARITYSLAYAVIYLQNEKHFRVNRFLMFVITGTPLISLSLPVFMLWIRFGTI